MATKGKECSQVKEKRGISPSYPRHTDTTQRRKSPNPAVQASPDQKNASTAAQKHVPNYLKPTLSSALDPSKQHVKKQASSDTTHKPTLTRRRSFDKPPSPTPVHKSHTSPNSREKSLRSSTISSKTTPLPKPHPERLLKAPKDVRKPHSLNARPVDVKKSSTTVEKQNNSSTKYLTKKAPSTGSPHIADAPKIEPLQDDEESSVTEAEAETVNVESNNELLAEILIIEDKEHVDILHTEIENDEGEEINICESSVVSEVQNVSPDDQIEEPEVEILIEEGEDSAVENPKDDKSHPEESFAGEPKVDIIEKKEEGQDGATENPNGRALDEKEEADGGIPTVESKEIEEAEGAAKEVKPEIQNVAGKQQGGQGKKDSTAYNDVIEETASKLREQRKNKVKALVGAFETVISLQEPEAN